MTQHSWNMPKVRALCCVLLFSIPDDYFTLNTPKLCAYVMWYTACYALIHWGRGKMAFNSQMTFSNAFLPNENVWLSIKISLKFVPHDPINNIPALVQIISWCQLGNKPLSESVMVRLPTHASLDLNELINCEIHSNSIPRNICNWTIVSVPRKNLCSWYNKHMTSNTHLFARLLLSC